MYKDDWKEVITMAYLSWIYINGDKEHGTFENVYEQSFNVCRTFFEFFPKKFVLDGNGQLSIIFDKNKSMSNKKYICFEQCVGTSVYYPDMEEIEMQQNLVAESKDEFYLSIIVNALKYIAKELNREDEIAKLVEETAEKVRNHKYGFVQKIKKLSKISSNRFYKAETYEDIGTLGERNYIIILDKDGNSVKYNITEEYRSIVLKKSVYACIWEEERFILIDRFHRELVIINPCDKSMFSVYSGTKSCNKYYERYWPRIEVLR